MNTTLPFELPEELIARTAEIPGFATRLRLWVRAEVTQYDKRQHRYSEEARAITERAFKEAEEMKASGISREVVMERFIKNYDEIMQSI